MKYEFVKNPQMIYASNLLDLKDKWDQYRYLRIENSNVTATNGKALINFTLDFEVENGYYKVIKKTKNQTHIVKVKEIGDFFYPEYELLLNPSEHEQIYLSDLKAYNSLNTGLSCFIFDFIKNGSQTINLKYLDCIDCLDNDFTCYKHAKMPYLIKSGSTTIIIMGIWRG